MSYLVSRTSDMIQFGREFVEKLRNKDEQCFGDLYMKTSDVFFRYLKSRYYIDHHDIENILSDFYYKLWVNLDTINVEEKFESFLWTVLVNLVKDYFKKSEESYFADYQADNGEDDVRIEEILPDGTDLVEDFDFQFKSDMIQEAMISLDDLTKDIFHWKFVEGMTTLEISEMMSLNHENVRKKLSRGLQLVKDKLS